MWVFKSIVFLGCLAVSSAWAEQPFEVEIDSAAMRQAKQATDTAKRNINSDVLKEAEALMDTVRSAEYQAKIKSFQQSLSQKMGVAFSPAEAATNENSTENKNSNNIKNSSSRVYVFISSAMGERALRKTIREVAKLPNGVVVLRGFVGGAKKVKPTLKFIADILKKDPSCTGVACELYAVEVNIDPIRFTRYGINRVPAVVYEPDEQFMGYCSGDALKQSSDLLVVYGEAGLRYVLETIQEEQPAPGLTELIAYLEPIPWEHLEKSGHPDYE